MGFVTIIKNFSRQFQTNCKKIPSYIHYVGQRPLVYRTIGQQLEIAAEKFGESEALVSCHENERLTFSEVQYRVESLSAGLQKLGLEKGDRLGIWAPNTTQWYLSFLAAARIGLIAVGINPAFQAGEVKFCLNKVGVKSIVIGSTFKTQNYYEILKSVIPELAECQPGKIKSENVLSLRSVIVDSNEVLPGSYRFKDIFLPADCNTSTLSEPDSPCNIQFTSGTTGYPKAATLSHFNFINNSTLLGIRNGFNTKHHKICCQVPLFHAYGLVGAFLSSIAFGSTVVLPSIGFNAEDSLKAIAKENCTFIYGTPTMYVDLVKKKRDLNIPTPSLESALTAGAHCPTQLLENMKNVLKIPKIHSAFGMTECTAVSFQTFPDKTDNIKENRVGHIQDHLEAKVIDVSGNIVPFGEPGELCIRGYSTMLGYFNDEVKTKEIQSPDGWLRTGDQFILEETGYGKIVGRIKDIIIRGGENIFPQEIEDFLSTHPDIMEVSIAGIPDERMGEEICAFIRLRANIQTITQSKIQDFCKGKISHFKIPRFIRIVNDFPRTTSGKIQKFKLKDMFF